MRFCLISPSPGVLQGSVLGPSLLLYYINDIPTGLYSTIKLFADDIIAYLVIKSNSDALTLQRDLDKLAQWGPKKKYVCLRSPALP